MNRTIISIEVQDHGGKEANIIVRGERNNQILFEEQFEYKDEDKHPLRLHFLHDKHYNENWLAKGKNLAIICIRKLLKDVSERSEYKASKSDYRVREHKNFTFDDYKAFHHRYFPTQTDDVIEADWKAIQSLPKGTIIRLPDIQGCSIGSFEVC